MGGRTPEAQTWEGILSPLVDPLIWEAARLEHLRFDQDRTQICLLFPGAGKPHFSVRGSNRGWRRFFRF
jgi:hypothetical protein